MSSQWILICRTSQGTRTSGKVEGSWNIEVIILLPSCVLRESFSYVVLIAKCRDCVSAGLPASLTSLLFIGNPGIAGRFNRTSARTKGSSKLV